MSKIFVDEIAGIVSADTVAIPGHVIQVVSGSTTTSLNTSSTTYVDSGVSASITPSATSSKILVIVSLHAGINDSGGNGAETAIQIVRDATQISEYQRGIFLYDSNGGTMQADAVISLSYLDSPSTTSSVTYKPQVKTASGQFRVNDYSTSTNSMSTITLMEIAG